MSVTSYKLIHTGRDGGDEVASDGMASRRYTSVYRVVTDDANDDAKVVLQSLPDLATSYAPAGGVADPGAWCRRRRARNESFSKKVWIATLAFSSATELADSPLDDPATIEWHTESYSRPYYKDRNGEWILNSAGDPFDPPIEADDSRWTIVVTKNMFAVPTWYLFYQDALNSTAIEIDGVQFAAWQLKCSGIDIGSQQERNDIRYRVVTLTLQPAPMTGNPLVGWGDPTTDGWTISLLDEGFRQIDSTTGELVAIEDITAPVPLNGAGRAIPDPSPTNAVGLDFDLYKLLDFNNLVLE